MTAKSTGDSEGSGNERRFASAIVTSPRPNRDIDDVFMVHGGVIGPEPFFDFPPRDDLPLPFDEHRQNLEGLLPEHSLIRQRRPTQVSEAHQSEGRLRMNPSERELRRCSPSSPSRLPSGYSFQ
jgi:hypothetical protein